MKPFFAAPGLAALLLALPALAGCEADLEADGSPLGGGSLDSSVAEAQAEAPEPTGQQLTHQEMREVLEETLDPVTLTDTDDWWPNLRDLNRELQRLEVQPTDCKPYVTASALPVPPGALGALAESDDSRTVIYTFTDTDAAQDYMDSERRGVERCQEHTVIRDLGEEEVEAETAVTELRVRTGAEDGLAVGRVMEAQEAAQRDLTVLLRQGPHTVLASVPEDSEAEQEEALAELEARAAEVLSALVGEEILAPEPEPEEESEADEEEDTDDAESPEETDTDDADDPADDDSD
jgi:ATP-dependent exoDNAse (exonuclease V) beta subunit